MSGIGQCVLGVLLVVLLEKLLSLPLQILVKLHQEAILQMALQNVLGRGVALLSSTHLCVVTVLHRPNVLVVMVVEIFMEEILMGNNLHILFMGKYLFYDTLLSKTLGFNSFIL